MTETQRALRGLFGTVMTWGVAGVILGLPVYLVLMRVWNIFILEHVNWTKIATQFSLWTGMSFVWGVAAGLLFALALRLTTRTQRIEDVGRTPVAVWGAIAGGAFPLLLVFPTFFENSNPAYYGAIVLASALTGAVLARSMFALAQRRVQEPVDV